MWIISSHLSRLQYTIIKGQEKNVLKAVLHSRVDILFSSTKGFTSVGVITRIYLFSLNMKKKRISYFIFMWIIGKVPFVASIHNYQRTGKVMFCRTGK